MQVNSIKNLITISEDYLNHGIYQMVDSLKGYLTYQGLSNVSFPQMNLCLMWTTCLMIDL